MAVMTLPIGSEAHPFVGCFDGQGHTISGLTVYVVDHSNRAVQRSWQWGQIG